MDDKEFDKIAKMKSLESMSKWYSWDSPIGLSIFLLTVVLNIVILKWTFF
ncbi:MAG TPA: hypothetical protein VNW29_03635 [Candidatus Sulfotelmatobacter sp.]|jgi:hypothetical protein|nr:hypothetical protein [Candidatus Sulfotelmatobacter sp.]